MSRDEFPVELIVPLVWQSRQSKKQDLHAWIGRCRRADYGNNFALSYQRTSSSAEFLHAIWYKFV